MKIFNDEDRKAIEGLNSIKAKALELTGKGYSVADIASILGVSEGTVSYHRRNPESAKIEKVKIAIDAEELARKSSLKEKVTFLTTRGYSVAEISSELGVSEGTVSYHRRAPKDSEITLEKAEAELLFWSRKVEELRG